jgi:hypothetical protein
MFCTITLLLLLLLLLLREKPRLLSQYGLDDGLATEELLLLHIVKTDSEASFLSLR